MTFRESCYPVLFIASRIDVYFIFLSKAVNDCVTLTDYLWYFCGQNSKYGLFIFDLAHFGFCSGPCQSDHASSKLSNLDLSVITGMCCVKKMAPCLLGRILTSRTMASKIRSLQLVAASDKKTMVLFNLRSQIAILSLKIGFWLLFYSHELLRNQITEQRVLRSKL